MPWIVSNNEAIGWALKPPCFTHPLHRSRVECVAESSTRRLIRSPDDLSETLSDDDGFGPDKNPSRVRALEYASGTTPREIACIDGH